MEKTKLIQDEKRLTQMLGTFKTAYHKVHTAAHILMVSVLAHAAKHGNPDMLNRFYSVLATNDKTAARLYINRVQTVLGGWDGVTVQPAEIMEAYRDKGQWLKYSKSAFVVMSNADHPTAKAAKAKMSGLADTIINPDGKVWRPFLERNNLAEIKTFGDDELRKSLDALIKSAKGEKKNVDPHVSKANLEALYAAQKVIGEPVQSVQL